MGRLPQYDQEDARGRDLAPPYSRFPDLHTPEEGPTGSAGNLCFLWKDGSIGPGHEVFNAF